MCVKLECVLKGADFMNEKHNVFYGGLVGKDNEPTRLVVNGIATVSNIGKTNGTGEILKVTVGEYGSFRSNDTHLFEQSFALLDSEPYGIFFLSPVSESDALARLEDYCRSHIKTMEVVLANKRRELDIVSTIRKRVVKSEEFFASLD